MNVNGATDLDLRAPIIGGRLYLEVSQGNGGFNHKKSTNMWRFTIAPTVHLWHFCAGENAQRISSSYNKRYDCTVGNSTQQAPGDVLII